MLETSIITANNLKISSTIQDGDIVFAGNDGGSTITALTLDMSAAGNATFNGTVLASSGTAALPSLSFSGDPNTGIYSSSADNLGFAIGGVARAWMSASQFNMTGNGIFSGNGTFGGTLGVTGAATFSSTVTIGGNLLAEDIKSKNSGGLTFQTNDGSKRIIIENGGSVVINELGADANFRVESDGNANMLFVDGGANKVGVGTSSPATALDVAGVASTLGLTVLGGGVATGYIGEITNDSGAAGGRDGLKVETLLSDATTKILTAASNGVDRFVVTGTGAATFSSTIAATSATFVPSSGENVVITRDSAGPYIGTSSNHSLRIITNNGTAIAIATNKKIAMGSATDGTAPLHLKYASGSYGAESTSGFISHATLLMVGLIGLV